MLVIMVILSDQSKLMPPSSLRVAQASAYIYGGAVHGLQYPMRVRNCDHLTDTATLAQNTRLSDNEDEARDRSGLTNQATNA